VGRQDPEDSSLQAAAEVRQLWPAAYGDRDGLAGEIRFVHLDGSAVDSDIVVCAVDLKHLDRLVTTVKAARRLSKRLDRS
jgi:hypothetical protein